MGLFDGRRRLCFDVPKEQADIVNAIIRAAKNENPRFDPNDFFSDVLSFWIDNNWRDVIRKIAYKGKHKKRK